MIHGKNGIDRDRYNLIYSLFSIHYGNIILVQSD